MVCLFDETKLVKIRLIVWTLLLAANNRIGDVGCSHLARMLAHNVGILELDLSGNRIRAKGASFLGMTAHKYGECKLGDDICW